jgi:flagellar basal body rod protein FlgB
MAPSKIDPHMYITQRAPQNGISSVTLPQNNITNVDAPVFGQRKVPFQTVANTPRTFNHQPDTLTVYRNF